MSTIEEIEAAIRALPAADRERLMRDLPNLFPELDGDAGWDRLIHDTQSRPALSRMLDEVGTAVWEDKAKFPATSADEFNHRL